MQRPVSLLITLSLAAALLAAPVRAVEELPVEAPAEPVPLSDGAWDPPETEEAETETEEDEEDPESEEIEELEEEPLLIAPAPDGQEPLPFTDVAATSVFYDNIRYVLEQGLFQGRSSTTFDPGGTMTRAAFVTVLYRHAAGRNEDMTVLTDPPFTDTAQLNAEFRNAIAWGAAHGIVQGTSATTFGPASNVSRQQMCAFIVRYLRDYLGYDLSDYAGELTFADSDRISTYAREAVAIVQSMGIISGRTAADGSAVFDPQGDASRGAVAKVVSLMAQAIPGLRERPATVPDALTGSDGILPSGGSGSTGSGSSGASNSGSGGGSGGGSSEGSGGGSGGGGGGGSGGGGGGDTTTDRTDEDLAVSYMKDIIDRYDKHTIEDPEVKACLDILIGTIRDAAAKHDSGVTVDRSYVESQYATEVHQFLDAYDALSEDGKRTARNEVVSLAPLYKLTLVMDWFGVSADSFA